MKYDYISILAGGNCPMNCNFCVGKAIRKNVQPHFAEIEKIKIFLELNKERANFLSVSGSTSDPLYVKNFNQIVELCKKYFRLSLHTCAKSQLSKINTNDFEEICISLHGYPTSSTKKFIKRNVDKIRISSVYHINNKEIFDDLSFFDKTPANLFTLRLNVFDPQVPKFIKKLKPTGRKLFNQIEYSFKNKKIVVWNFADANKYINARYLWPDGKMRMQCYWHNLHGLKV